MIWHSQWKSWIMTRSVSAVSACNRRFSSNQLFIYQKLEIPGLNRLLLQGEGKDDVPYKHVHNSQADVWYPISRGSNSIFCWNEGRCRWIDIMSEGMSPRNIMYSGLQKIHFHSAPPPNALQIMWKAVQKTWKWLPLAREKKINRDLW